MSHWQAGRFIRQPGILSGTVDLFYRQRMPNLKNEAAQNITQAREALLALYDHVRRNKKRYVVMVNGRPGAGKTLLGMTVVTELARRYKPKDLHLYLFLGMIHWLRY